LSDLELEIQSGHFNIIALIRTSGSPIDLILALDNIIGPTGWAGFAHLFDVRE
jgi:hypothetical protein